MARSSGHPRFKYLRTLWQQGIWGKLLGGIWTLIGLAVLVCDDFLSPVSQAKLKLPVIATFLSGQLWTIVLLLILIGWLFEASFRSYRRELDTVADLNSRLSPKIKISVAGKGVSEDIDVKWSADQMGAIYRARSNQCSPLSLSGMAGAC